MVALVACFVFGAVTGAAGYATARSYYWRRALKSWPLRTRYRRYHLTRHSRALHKWRPYRPSRYRLSRLLDRLESTYDDSELRASDLRR